MELQKKAEERVGFVMRYAAQLARAREDAAFAQLRSAVGEDDAG